MATREDATLSIYYQFNQFAQSLTSEPDLPEFSVIVTTSIEAAGTLLMDGTNKLILVQSEFKEKLFVTLEYRMFVSFADDLDINAVLTTKVISLLAKYMPRYFAFDIYEAEGLSKPISEFNSTGCKLVVSAIEQKTTSIPQMRNNLTAAVINFTGYLN